MFFLIFKTQNTNANGIFFFFSILYKSLTLTGNFMSLKSSSSFLGKSISAFVILLRVWSARYKYMTKQHLKY